jgi:outer membrane receptor protein involved in Fe transport
MGKVILEHLSSRFTDIENTDELEGVFNLGAVLEYKLRNNILLSLGVYNILGTKIYYWDNYQERPFELMLGASLLFD